VTEHAVDLVANLVRRRKSNGRCVYERAAKQALVLRCLQPGVSLAGTALAHGLNANLLRKWVVAYARQNGIPTTIDGRRRTGSVLLPVRAVVEPVGSAAASGTDARIEIVIAGGTIRVHGRVDAAQLRIVIDCLAARL
jgi:transposase-like protein